MTDIEIINDELNYIIEQYHDELCTRCEELKEARQIMRNHKNGFDFEIINGTFFSVEEADAYIKEYNQTVYYSKKVKSMITK